MKTRPYSTTPPRQGPRLYTFKVIGWLRDANGANPKHRDALPEMTIDAPTAQAAQAHYARAQNIPDRAWADGSASPLVVIRCESLTPSKPKHRNLDTFTP